jgi:hypothetical protein
MGGCGSGRRRSITVAPVENVPASDSYRSDSRISRNPRRLRTTTRTVYRSDVFDVSNYNTSTLRFLGCSGFSKQFGVRTDEVGRPKDSRAGRDSARTFSNIRRLNQFAATQSARVI